MSLTSIVEISSASPPLPSENLASRPHPNDVHRLSLAQDGAMVSALLAAELGHHDTALDRAGAIACEHARAETLTAISATLVERRRVRAKCVVVS